MSEDTPVEAQLRSRERVEDTGNSLLSGNPGLFYLSHAESVDLVRLLGKAVNPQLARHQMSLVPTDEGAILEFAAFPSAAVCVTGRITKSTLEAYENYADVAYPLVPRSKIGIAITAALLNDLKSRRRGAAFLAVLVATLATWLPLGEYHLGDPAVQLITTTTITIASVYLAVFALFSGLARSQVSGSINEYRALYHQYTQDRILLSWVVLAISLSATALIIFCIQTPATRLLAWPKHLLTYAAMSAGAACIAPPVTDVIPFFLGRSITLSALQQTASRITKPKDKN